MKKIFTTMTLISVVLATSCTCRKSADSLPENARYFALVELKTDVSQFSEKEKQMLSYLFDAADLMNEVFWKQAYSGCKRTFLKQFKDDSESLAFANINYGPWERLNGNLP